MTLDQNACCCCDCLLNPKPHDLTDKESLEYSTDLEYQEAPMESSFCPCGDSPPPPTTPPSDIDKFTHPSPQVEEGQATSFGCDVTFDVMPDLEEDVLPPLENVTPILIVVDCGIPRVEPGEIDFIPFQVCGQHCKHMKGIPTSTYHPYQHCLIKGQCCCDLGGWCDKSDCCGGQPFRGGIGYHQLH